MIILALALAIVQAPASDLGYPPGLFERSPLMQSHGDHMKKPKPKPKSKPKPKPKPESTPPDDDQG